MQQAAVQPRSSSHKILPVVTRVIEQLDQVFIEFAGQAGEARLQRAFHQWLTSGKTSPSGLRHYVYGLEVQLSDPSVRAEFSKRADRILIHLQSGYAS